MTKHFRLTSGQFSHFTPPENVFRGYIALGTNGLITISLLIPLILKKKRIEMAKRISEIPMAKRISEIPERSKNF